MRVLLSSKSTQITDRQREYAEKKLGKLARYFNSARNANLTHSVQRNLHTVEVMVDLDGILVRAEERSPDFFASLDVAADKLEKQVRRLKERIKHHKGRADAPAVAAALAEIAPADEEIAPEEANGRPSVVRRKRFAIKPMTVEEAGLQMDLLQHDFHAFLDYESGQVHVLYRRQDGNYGLLELES